MTLERRTWWIGRTLALLLILLGLRVGYWQLWRGRALEPVAFNPVASAREYARLRGEPVPGEGLPEAASLAQLPQPVIQRTVQMLANIQRGTIVDRRGVVLAEDQGRPGSWTRVYSEPSLAHTLGYASGLRTGIMGLESTYNRQLLGLDRPDTEIDRLLHRPVFGSNLVLTIDSQVQRAAAESLAGRAGAVVALDGQTGAVLAMASAPSFDPNQMNNSDYVATLATSTALINRVTQSLYTPGSTFKTVTLIAALDSGQVNPRTVFDFGEPRTDPNGRIYYTYVVDGGVIIDPNHREDRLSLEMAFVRSANVAFAKMAHDMPPNTFIEYGRRMGFSTPDYTRRFPLELPVAVPQLAYDVDDLRRNDLLRAHTGYGQGELLTSPLNMAMVVQAVVNNGQLPLPYLVEEIRDPEGNVISRRPNQHAVRGIMSAPTAQIVREAMIAMVTTFYEDTVVPGAVVGGKTGTAELGEGREPHGWFIGFAEQNGRTVVIAVILENAGSGARAAIPVFQQVAAAALNRE